MWIKNNVGVIRIGWNFEGRSIIYVVRLVSRVIKYSPDIIRR
jgi:hypothetical protein